jgi:hypothetical protein
MVSTVSLCIDPKNICRFEASALTALIKPSLNHCFLVGSSHFVYKNDRFLILEHMSAIPFGIQSNQS